jgi:signal transduction histidine kinase
MIEEPSSIAAAGLEGRRATELHARLLRLGALLEAALAEERERRRIAASLHDRLGQALALAQIRLYGLHDVLPREARPGLDEVTELLRGALETTRSLTFDLVPPLLHDLGPSAAIDWLVEQLAASHGLVVAIERADLPALDPDVAAVLFRVVRELLTHVAERTPRARAGLLLFHDGEHVGVEVADGSPVVDEPAPTFFAVREEIRACGGALELCTTPAGATRIRVRVPLRAPRGGGEA